MLHSFGKIGVVFGGLSSERDISLKSGRAIFEALNGEKIDVVEIDLTTEIPKEVEGVIRDAAVDIVFVAMHGRFGEDGKLQSVLEKMNMAYVGSDSMASALAMNKIASHKLFEENNIPTPGYSVLNKDQREILDRKNLQFPLVVKPKSQGSSIGVSFLKNTEEVDRALDLAFQYDDNIIIEEYIKGRELTVSILDSIALEPIEILPKRQFFDYQAKYNKGMTDYIIPAPIDNVLKGKIQYLSLKAHKSIGCRHFSRVDLLVDEDSNPFILEVNTIPGFTSNSLLPKAALYHGITFSQLCLNILALTIKDTATSLKE